MMAHATPEKEIRSEGDLYYLAEAIYFEARGEPFVGQVAVAQNIMHRVDSLRFLNSIEEVVHEKRRSKRTGKKVCMYSYFCDGESDKMVDEVAKKEAFRVANLVIREEIPDLIRGADHYFNPNLVLPSWASKMKFIVRIGDHVFYKTRE